MADSREMAVDRLWPLSSGSGDSWVYLHDLASKREGQESCTLVEWARVHGEDCVRMDMRAHGDSDGDLFKLTLTNLVEDIHNVLLYLNVHDEARAGRGAHRHVLVGNSVGGLAAAWVADQWPELVRGLVLLAPAFGLGERIMMHNKAQQRPDGVLLPCPNSKYVDSIHLGPEMLQDIQTGKYASEEKLASTLNVPTFIAHGDADTTVHCTKSSDFFLDAISCRKEFCLIPGGQHRLKAAMPMVMDKAQAFFDRDPFN